MQGGSGLELLGSPGCATGLRALCVDVVQGAWDKGDGQGSKGASENSVSSSHNQLP